MIVTVTRLGDGEEFTYKDIKAVHVNMYHQFQMYPKQGKMRLFDISLFMLFIEESEGTDEYIDPSNKI